MSSNLFKMDLDSKVTPLEEKADPVEIASICPLPISILPPGTSILD